MSADIREGKPCRRLLLACGNALRSDDGVGLAVAAVVEADPRFAGVKVVAAPQFTPEFAALLAEADCVVFVDACSDLPPGEVRLLPVEACAEQPYALTHHLTPAALLELTQSLYGRTPNQSATLAIGAASFALGEELSQPVRAAVPQALSILKTIFEREVSSLD